MEAGIISVTGDSGISCYGFDAVANRQGGMYFFGIYDALPVSDNILNTMFSRFRCDLFDHFLFQKRVKI